MADCAGASEVGELEMAKQKEIWFQREDESNQAYLAFEQYRDAGPTRSLKRCYQDSQIRKGRPEEEARELPISGRWFAWYKQHEWALRCEAYDAHNSYMQLVEQAEARKDMNMRHASLAMMAQQKIIMRLQSLRPEELSPRDCITWLEIAVKVERQARGESAENITQRIIVDREIAELDELKAEALRGIREMVAQMGVSLEKAVKIAMRGFALPEEMEQQLLLEAGSPPSSEGEIKDDQPIVIDGEFEVVTDDEVKEETSAGELG